MNRIAPYYKAVVAFIAPAAGSLIIAVTESSVGGSTITTAEWITAACLCVTTSAAVYIVPNKPAVRDPQIDGF